MINIESILQSVRLCTSIFIEIIQNISIRMLSQIYWQHF